MRKIVFEFDLVICEIVVCSCSFIYDNVSEVMNIVMVWYESVCFVVGKDGWFFMWVIDSKQIFVGQGLLVVYMFYLMKKNFYKNVLCYEVEIFFDSIFICVILRDLYYICECVCC